MQFGSFMEFHRREGHSQADAFREAFGHIELSESLGLDAVWLAESHFNPVRSVLSSPHAIASAIAARTKRLRIGTAVSVLPLGNPLRTAEEAATIDQISEGRFEFGVGRSGLPGSYEGYNIPYSESRERFYEYLEIILEAWCKERFTYKGQFYGFDDVCLVPKPYQQPHPPIRIAATTSDTFPVVGKMGFAIFVGVRGMNLDGVAEQVESYRAAWKAAGHEGEIDVSLRVPVYVGETEEDALTAPEESFMRQFRRLGGQLAASASRAGSDPGEERAERGAQLASIQWERDVIGQKAAVGTPEMVIEQLKVMKDALSLTGVAAEFNAGELIPEDKISNSLRLFCEEVIPAFR
jgi:alkanesulfonate monooxygenase SsuD/methylene tetrahydromethanopterin reductase-like flavin-dependent oxidoreductase (luciferase family)